MSPSREAAAKEAAQGKARAVHRGGSAPNRRAGTRGRVGGPFYRRPPKDEERLKASRSKSSQRAGVLSRAGTARGGRGRVVRGRASHHHLRALGIHLGVILGALRRQRRTSVAVRAGPHGASKKGGTRDLWDVFFSSDCLEALRAATRGRVAA